MNVSGPLAHLGRVAGANPGPFQSDEAARLLGNMQTAGLLVDERRHALPDRGRDSTSTSSAPIASGRATWPGNCLLRSDRATAGTSAREHRGPPAPAELDTLASPAWTTLPRRPHGSTPFPTRRARLEPSSAVRHWLALTADQAGRTSIWKMSRGYPSMPNSWLDGLSPGACPPTTPTPERVPRFCGPTATSTFCSHRGRQYFRHTRCPAARPPRPWWAGH